MLSATSNDQKRAREFRILCLKTGITASSIASRLGVHRSAVSQVISGRARSKKIEDEIARLFPALVRRYPFGQHGSKVARATKQVNCSGAQQGNPGRSPTKKDR